MNTSDERIDFRIMLGEIEEEKILLPDFQRKFRWTDRETQAKLVASVLCKMPIGSILLLNLPAKDYAARRIGSNSAEGLILLETGESRQFLLDGQQRVTVMVNAFSNLIHERGVTHIDSLKRRFFLGIPKKSEVGGEADWGLYHLRFPLKSPKNEIPQYMSEDIVENLVIMDFRKNEETPFNPYQEEGKDDLLSFCLGYEGYYLIPLYLLAQRSESIQERHNKRWLKNILEAVSSEMGRRLEERYVTKESQEEWIDTVWQDDREKMLEELEKESFDKLIRILQENWAQDMESYLISCLEQLNLHVMGVPNANRVKAIEIFENMNRGGVKLSTFDLVVARAARDNRNFSDALTLECQKEGEYPENFVPETVRVNCRSYIEKLRRERGAYSALCDLTCVDESKGELTKVFQDAFLNVLSLRCHDETRTDTNSRNFREEMSRDKILRLTSAQINGHFGECCRALDRAAFFLKARCGVRKIQEVNNQLMYTVLAYLFLDAETFRQQKVWDLLTAWYWCALFSGRYDKDQNVQASRDLDKLSQIIRTGKGAGYIWEMAQNALMVPYFSQKEFLLFEKSNESNIAPKEILAQYFCQFYLAFGYHDLLQTNLLLCTFPTEEEGYELEKHHIIPLMSTQSIGMSEKMLKRENMKNMLVNSPLNRIYITKRTNQKIASNDFSSYIKHIGEAATSELDLPTMEEQMREDDIRQTLANRHKRIKGRLTSKVRMWLAEWDTVQ